MNNKILSSSSNLTDLKKSTGMSFTLFCSDSLEQPTNCLYPNKIEVYNAETLIKAVSHDYVGAEYKNSYRSNDNFISSDCIIMDIDNNHSENPDEWVTPEKVAEIFKDVSFAVHYSRNNMKPKNNKIPRPKFHVLFPIEAVKNAEEYGSLKDKALILFPYFDRNALDVARLFYGTQNPEVQFFSGSIMLDKFLADKNILETEQNNFIIPEGERNSTMHTIACKLLTQFGDTSATYQKFIEVSQNCSPNLDDKELQNIWNSAVKSFNENVIVNENYIEPEIFNLEANLKPEDYSDIGQAKIIKREYKHKFRYCTTKTFLVYENGYWHEDEIKAQGIAQELTDRQLEEANSLIKKIEAEMKSNGTQNIIDNTKKSCSSNLLNEVQSFCLTKYKEIEEYKSFIMKHRNMGLINSSLSAVKSMITIKPDELDKNPFYLNTLNSTYNLNLGLNGKMQHNPDDFITKQTKVEPSNLGMDIWLNFLNMIFLNNQELIDYVQEVIGLASIGKVYHEALIIAYGNGANGKSSFFNAISKVLGSYSGTISANILTTGYTGNDKAEKAELRGKRFILASELGEDKQLNTAILKQLCSTDYIHAERKFEAPFSFIPSHTLVLCTNNLPNFDANDEGTKRRFIVIPFKARINKNQEIKNYADFLFNNSGGAILSWIIEGAEKIIKKGFKLNNPEIVEEATDNYKDENDWFSDFEEICCEIDPQYEESSQSLYSQYCNYCNNSLQIPKSTKVFYSTLDNKGYKRFKKGKNKTRMYRGIRLKNSNNIQ